MWKTLALAMLLLMAASPAIASDRKPMVAVSISGLLPLVEPIAGEEASIVTLLPSGVEAHHYTLQPDLVERAMRADLIIHTGHIPWELELVENVAKEKGVPVEKVSLDLLHDLDVQLLKEPGTEEPNVHAFWLLPDNAKLITKAVADRLAKLRPELADVFKHRAGTFARTLDLLFAQAEKGIAGKKVVIAFFAEQYVTSAFGLKPVLVLMKEGGLSPETLEEARKGLLNGTFKGIVYSEVAEGFPQLLGQIQALAEETGVPTYRIRVFGIGGLEDYTALMAYNLGSLSSISAVSGPKLYTEFYVYLSALLAIFAAAEAVVIAFLHRRLSAR